MTEKVAFITGASRGIGAESAVALAKAGYRVAITARTLTDGEQYDHAGSKAPMPGSLQATARAVAAQGGEALCLQADILDPASVIAAAERTLQEWGGIDLLFNNAVYQGTGNQETLLEVTPEQLQAIYQGNIFTPLALVQTVLPQMLPRGGTIINMLSATAILDPPAPASQGGWGFAYPSSKAALARMAGCLRAEHPQSNLRVFNIEPGTVITQLMKATGIDKDILERFKPCTPQAIAGVIAWLAANNPPQDWQPLEILRGAAIAKQLELLDAPSLLED
jgi:NAD(P)-dependent dehydrogenase (short-subunit alcohol dehydrogenase family)